MEAIFEAQRACWLMTCASWRPGRRGARSPRRRRAPCALGGSSASSSSPATWSGAGPEHGGPGVLLRRLGDAGAQDAPGQAEPLLPGALARDGGTVDTRPAGAAVHLPVGRREGRPDPDCRPWQPPRICQYDSCRRGEAGGGKLADYDRAHHAPGQGGAAHPGRPAAHRLPVGARRGERAAAPAAGGHGVHPPRAAGRNRRSDAGAVPAGARRPEPARRHPGRGRDRRGAAHRGDARHPGPQGRDHSPRRSLPAHRQGQPRQVAKIIENPVLGKFQAEEGAGEVGWGVVYARADPRGHRGGGGARRIVPHSAGARRGP